ncbi:MAG: helix-turn-helix transcriptional regulator [Steroidobacteraceae bacterium]
MTEIRHMNQVDLSRRLGVSCRTLERWRWTGVGPKFIKVGGRVKYRVADVEAFEQSRLCQSTADRHYFDIPKSAGVQA